jgi:hypothetical protein
VRIEHRVVAIRLVRAPIAVEVAGKEVQVMSEQGIMSEHVSSASMGAESAQTAPPSDSRQRGARLNTVLFVLSAAGVPIGIVTLRSLGRLGGLLLEVASGALCWRASAMVAAGTARRLAFVPRLLLFAETAVDGLTVVVGFWAWVWRPFVRPVLGERASQGQHRWLRTRPTASGTDRSWATPVAIVGWMAALVLHTARMAIYISPGRGLRKSAGDAP